LNKDDKKKILIVEGTDEVAGYLADILTAYGIIDIAHTGQEALTKISLNHYDVIIADATMPVMDGIELYKSAVEVDAALKNRFLFLTNSFFRYYLKFFADNDVSFLFKPADIEDINNAVQEILNEIPLESPDRTTSSSKHSKTVA
jgi:YesN/AraC family two-component response regulator